MAFLDGWTKAKAITVPAAYITGSLTNFPLLVQFTDDADIGAAALANGYDIRFTLSDGTTLCSYYRRSFVIAGGLATGLFDVLAPSLTSGVDATFYVYYGNASAPDVSNSAAVFGSAGAGFAGAWGFGDGVTLDLTDLSGNGNNGTNNGATAAAGIVGGAASFNGSSYIDFNNQASPLVPATSAWSITGWFKSSSSSQETIFAQYIAAGDNGRLLIRRSDADTSKVSYFLGNIGVHPTVNTEFGTIDNSGWNYFSVSRNGSLFSGTLNGGAAVIRTDSDATRSILQTANLFGVRTNSSGSYKEPPLAAFLSGSLDEFRISPVARSAPWVYLDWVQVGNVLLWGAEESATTPILVTQKIFPVSFLCTSTTKKDQQINFFVNKFYDIINRGSISQSTLRTSYLSNIYSILYSISKYSAGYIREWTCPTIERIWTVNRRKR